MDEQSVFHSSKRRLTTDGPMNQHSVAINRTLHSEMRNAQCKHVATSRNNGVTHLKLIGGHQGSQLEPPGVYVVRIHHHTRRDPVHELQRLDPHGLHPRQQCGALSNKNVCACARVCVCVCACVCVCVRVCVCV